MKRLYDVTPLEYMMKGKTIIVTGAASGIGAATAKLLTERGASVIAFDRNPVTEYCDQYIAIDLSNEASIVDAVAQFDGKADALCNIAGLPPTMPPELVLQVNVVGLQLFTEQIIPKLNRGAAIVNAASLAGAAWRQTVEKSKTLLEIRSMDAVAAFIEAHGVTEDDCYELSKEAVIVWTMQCWSRWKAQGIRMNAVSPSATKTPILQDFLETVAVRQKAKVAPIAGLPGPGSAENIAPVIAFLCSDDSRWLNGINIIADGGLAAARIGQQMGF